MLWITQNQHPIFLPIATLSPVLERAQSFHYDMPYYKHFPLACANAAALGKQLTQGQNYSLSSVTIPFSNTKGKLTVADSIAIHAATASHVRGSTIHTNASAANWHTATQ
jgi:hypothetical protein